MEKDDGTWHWTCFAGCGGGDEIDYLAKARDLTEQQATKQFLEMAGFPPHPPAEFPGCRESPKSHAFPEYPVSPVSNGQGLDKELEKELERLAARNTCTECGTARKRRWQLLRDLKAVEKRIGRELTICELMPPFGEWHRTSQPFLDPAKTRDSYLAAFLAELRKVRVPTGEGDTIDNALEAVSKLSAFELPIIPGLPDAPENLRRVAALHCEISRRCGGKTYFLSCRDTAKAFPGLNHRLACDINRALERLGVITIVRVGDQRPNGKASEFRYLLPQTEDGAPEAEGQNADDCPF
jgi:hypothetical protein